MQEGVAIAAITLAGSTVAGLIWVVKYLINKVIPLLEKLIKMTESNTEATKNADDYLKQRNGRDIEKHTELVEATRQIPITMQKIADSQANAIIKAVNIKEQNVEHQHIDRQTRGKNNGRVR